MREYLFRGKRTDNSEWVEGCLIHQGDYYLILQDESRLHPSDVPYISDLGCIDGYATPVIPESIGQYTGMKDKNGRKIFEGDIVKLTLIDGVEIGIIKFNDIMCRFSFYDKSGSYGFDNTCDFEVIGTVFEDSDLLEG